MILLALVRRTGGPIRAIEDWCSDVVLNIMALNRVMEQFRATSAACFSAPVNDCPPAENSKGRAGVTRLR